MKIAIVIGHNQRSQGAVRVLDGRTEYDWNGDLAERTAALNPAQVKVFRRFANHQGVGAELREVYRLVDAWGADLSAEIHFNSAAHPSAHGTETWFKSAAGREIAERINPMLVQAMGTQDRGAKEATPGDRPYGALVSGRAPAVLLELYFGSNAADCAKADDSLPWLPLAILTGLGGHVVGVPQPAPLTLEERVARIEAYLGL